MMTKDRIVAHFLGIDPVADDRFWRTARCVDGVRFRAVVPAGPAVPVEHYPNIEITLDAAHDIKLHPAMWGTDPAGWVPHLLAELEGVTDDRADQDQSRGDQGAAQLPRNRQPRQNRSRQSARPGR
jgi:hypothetical protein